MIEKEALAYHPVVPRSNIQMDITQPKIAIGFRGQPLESHQSVLRQELALKLFFGMVIGWTSHYYQDLYKKVISTIRLILKWKSTQPFNLSWCR